MLLFCLLLLFFPITGFDQSPWHQESKNPVQGPKRTPPPSFVCGCPTEVRGTHRSGSSLWGPWIRLLPLHNTSYQPQGSREAGRQVLLWRPREGREPAQGHTAFRGKVRTRHGLFPRAPTQVCSSLFSKGSTMGLPLRLPLCSLKLDSPLLLPRHPNQSFRAGRPPLHVHCTDGNTKARDG